MGRSVPVIGTPSSTEVVRASATSAAPSVTERCGRPPAGAPGAGCAPAAAGGASDLPEQALPTTRIRSSALVGIRTVSLNYGNRNAKGAGQRRGGKIKIVDRARL